MNKALSFHKITTSTNIGINHISPQFFKKILSKINIKLNNNVITFDDGFESVYKNAYPILEDANLKAIVFPIVYYIGKENKWDYNFTVNKSLHLNKNHLLELDKNGWEIGSHGFYHHPYSSMSHLEIKNDLIYSKKYLEDLLGSEVKSFSIPFNFYSPFLFTLIKDIGYEKIYFSHFYRSEYFKNNSNVIQRKQIFKYTSMNSIDKYLKSNNYNPPIIDKFIQFASSATVGLKHLL